MAVDVFSENLVDALSPRYSFSHDLEEEEDLTTTTTSISNNNPMSCRLDHILLDSNPFDFAFNIDSTTVLPSSTADELFSNGRILPTEVKKEEIVLEHQTKTPSEKNPETLTPCLDPHPTPASEPKKKSLKEFLEDSIEEEEPNSTPTKPFWKFRRSNSLNFDKKRLFGSFKILSRSGSTGKFLEKIVEEDESYKPVNAKSFWKFGRSSSLNSSVVNANSKGLKSNQFQRSSSLNCTISDANQRLKGSANHLSRSKSTGSAPNQVGNQKNNGKSSLSSSNSQNGKNKKLKVYGYGNGNNNYSSRNNIRISPVLNLPSPYISRVSVDLFGFGSLFCNGSRDRKKKKY